MSFLTPSVCESDAALLKNWIVLPGKEAVMVQEEWRELLRKAGLQTAADFFSVMGEPLSKPGLGKRYRARLHLAGQDSPIYLKRYGGEKLSSLIQRWFEDGKRNTPSEREVEVALALRQQQIAAAAPIAFGRDHRFGTRGKNFVMTTAVAGESLENFFRSSPKMASAEKQKIIAATAEMARKFHGLGWRHRDFYLCHVFIFQKENEIQLTLIDLARVFRPRWRKERWQIKDLAQLNFSATQTVFSRVDRLRFMKNYFGCNQFSSAQKNLLRKIARKTESIARHHLKVQSR